MSEQANVQQLILNLPCRVHLPEDPETYFAQRGPLTSHYEEQRRYPRFHCRTEAALVCKQTLPACPRQERTCRIYVKDISRSSIAFLHFEQLFPTERAEVILFDGGVRTIQITRCRKLQDDCYEVVGQFKVVLD